MASERRLRRWKLPRRLKWPAPGVVRPDRKPMEGRSSIGVASEVELSRFDSHDCPLLSREPSVSVSPVWISHDESLLCRGEDSLVVESVAGTMSLLCPSPSLLSAPEGVPTDGVWIVTSDLFFLFAIAAVLSRVRELARLWAAEPGLDEDRIPPGEGRLAMWEMLADVWSSDVLGSKYAE